MMDDAYESEDFQYILDYFQTEYLPRFKELVGEDDIDMVQLRDMCKYIYWAEFADLEMKFTPTEEDLKYIHAYVDTEGYYSDYGIKELTSLRAFDFFQMFKEIGQHLEFGTPMEDLPVFNKYYSIAYGEEVGLQFPKIAIFNGHATTTWPLLDALGFMYYPEVPPASGVYLEYWRTGTSHFVKMFYEVLNADGSYD
mmetsp:Transcript_3466/g.3420  ORF Transcript_3466/g.3420 Transcript_3466/m.3420 type:complete len:196 (-) Transcript_3466:77-664(-)